jgi:hypothetical protein
MSNRTYVCLDCKTSRRAEAAYGLVHNFRCSVCSQSLFELPWRRRIPSKDDGQGWKELSALIVRLEMNWIPRRTALGKAEIEKIDGALRAAKSEEKREKLLFDRRTGQKKYNVEPGGSHDSRRVGS